VSRYGYYKYLNTHDKPDKYAPLLAEIRAIIAEDEFNDKYGRERIHDALILRGWDIGLSTVYRICRKQGLLSKQNKPKGLTKADKKAYKNDDFLKGDFDAEEPDKKLISDITQLPTADGTLYISGVFDCFDNICAGLAMDDNMRTPLVIDSLKMAVSNIKQSNDDNYPIFHTDRGSQYTSYDFREFSKGKIIQSMSYAGSGCHGNAKCESLWARFKEEAIYGRYKTENMSIEEVKSLVFRYFMGYWNNRRISHTIGGMPPVEKRRRFYQNQKLAA
jgi:transposase InsO family protein